MADKHAYMSIVDPGHASTLWKMKDPLLTQENDNYQQQIGRVFRFNLLFRQSITVRHIDLFNNVALMDFMESPGAGALCRSGCLKVTVPDSRSLRQHFDKWAFRGDSQHWHHLTAEEQAEYDLAQFKELPEAKALEELEQRLKLWRFKLNLRDVVDGFDWRFTTPNRVILEHAPSSEKYADDVLKQWNALLLNKDQLSLHDAKHLDAISTVLAKGAGEKWRRRRFYTELEALEAGFAGDGLTKNAVATAKISAVNQAFYNELERMGTTAPDVNPVAVSRDITYLLDGVPRNELQDEGDTHFGDKLKLLDSIDLGGIANWRMRKGDEYDAFRTSVALFESRLNSAPGTYSQRQINKELKEHVEIVNECIKRTAKDTGKKIDDESSYISVKFPRIPESVPNIISPILRVAGPLSTFALEHWTGHTGVSKLVVGEGLALAAGALDLGTKWKVKKKEWRNIEVMVKDEMKKEINRAGEVGAQANGARNDG